MFTDVFAKGVTIDYVDVDGRITEDCFIHSTNFQKCTMKIKFICTDNTPMYKTYSADKWVQHIYLFNETNLERQNRYSSYGMTQAALKNITSYREEDDEEEAEEDDENEGEENDEEEAEEDDKKEAKENEADGGVEKKDMEDSPKNKSVNSNGKRKKVLDLSDNESQSKKSRMNEDEFDQDGEDDGDQGKLVHQLAALVKNEGARYSRQIKTLKNKVKDLNQQVKDLKQQVKDMEAGIETMHKKEKETKKKMANIKKTVLTAKKALDALKFWRDGRGFVFRWEQCASDNRISSIIYSCNVWY